MKKVKHLPRNVQISKFRAFDNWDFYLTEKYVYLPSSAFGIYLRISRNELKKILSL